LINLSFEIFPKKHIKNWIIYKKREKEWVEGRDYVKIPLEQAFAYLFYRFVK